MKRTQFCEHWDKGTTILTSLFNNLFRLARDTQTHTHILRLPQRGLVPALWLQGPPLFFTPNTDIITSLKDPSPLAFSLPLAPHTPLVYTPWICTVLTHIHIQDSILFIQLLKCLTRELHINAWRPLCLQSLAFCVYLQLASLIPFICQKLWLSCELYGQKGFSTHNMGPKCNTCSYSNKNLSVAGCQLQIPYCHYNPSTNNVAVNS